MKFHVWKFDEEHIMLVGGAPTKDADVDMEFEISRGQELFGRPFEDYARAADGTGLIEVDLPEDEE